MPFWESNIFWGVAGIVGAVVGVIVSAFFFFLGKSKKLLEYQVTSVDLIMDKIANIRGIEVTFNGKPIKSLVSTTIKFTNSGNQTINSDDFAKLEPLNATITGQFLNAQHGYKVSSSNPNSYPTIEIKNDNTAIIKFDFLKPKQSLTITLWHSGNLSVGGELKAGKIYEYQESYLDLKTLLNDLWMCNIAGFFPFFITTWMCFGMDLTSYGNKVSAILICILIAIMLALFIDLLICLVLNLFHKAKQNHIQ